jgi:hypothetical protein
MEDAGEVSSCSSSEVVWLARVCVQTSVNTTVVTGLGTNTKCQIPGTRKGALEESEMEKAAAAVRLGSVPYCTAATNNKANDRTSKEVRRRCRSGGLEAAYLESLITWASTGIAGAARA